MFYRLFTGKQEYNGKFYVLNYFSYKFLIIILCIF